MADASALPPPRPGIRDLLTKPWAIPAGVAIVAIAALAILRPNFGLLSEASPVIRIHLGAAVGALALGVVMMASRKGRTFHRIAGWTWAAVMFTVAASSLFITELNGDKWSFIHLISGWTLISVPLAVYAARRHSVKNHRRAMMSLFYGGLIIAGAFTFIPGRLMFRMFFGG